MVITTFSWQSNDSEEKFHHPLPFGRRTAAVARHSPGKQIRIICSFCPIQIAITLGSWMGAAIPDLLINRPKLLQRFRV